MKNLFPLLFSLLLIALLSCGDDGKEGSEDKTDDFDRKAMLVDMVDGIILPSLEDYAEKVEALNDFAHSFEQDPNAGDLEILRDRWLAAYKSWQYVSMFNIGKAEEIGLRNFTNIFPANVVEIEENITGGTYNLLLPSKNDEQGFPALDYLLYGVAADQASIVAKLDEPAYSEYLISLTDRMENMANAVLVDWKSGYRESFINNDGASATSSVNKIVNDYLFYYEKFLRAGKIGIPAGVFSGDPLADRVEAFYAKDVSKELFLVGLDAVQRFFNGQAYQSDATGSGLKAYLDYLNTIKEGEDLGTLINDQFDSIRNKASELDDDLSLQVKTDNLKMLETYDELQKNVVFLKVDMLQALNIKIDFVDADGD